MKLYSIVILVFAFLTVNCQSIDSSPIKISDGGMYFIGYQSNQPLLIDEQYNVSVISFQPNGNFSLKKIKDLNDLHSKNLLFIHDDIEVYGKDWGLIILKNGKSYEVKIDKKYIGGGFMPRFCVFNNLLIFALNAVDNLNEEFRGDYLRYVDLNKITETAVTLPFFCSDIKLSVDWLYYSESILNDDGTITSSNIFKIKLGDWQKKELLIRENMTEGWFVTQHSPTIIYSRTLFNKKNTSIAFDVNSKRFAVLDENVAKEFVHQNDPIFFTQGIYFITKISLKGKQETYLTPFPFDLTKLKLESEF